MRSPESVWGCVLIFVICIGPVAAAMQSDNKDYITARVSVDSLGNQVGSSSASYRESISADGRYITFFSEAENLVGGDNNAVWDVFVHDRLTGETTRASVSSSGVGGNWYSGGDQVISSNGRYVAFSSLANNLVDGLRREIWRTRDIFLHDLITRETTQISVDSNGVPGNADSAVPSISADGRLIAFSSQANNLVTSDTNNEWDVFVHDRVTGTTTRVSVSSGGDEGDRDSGSEAGSISISADDGRYVGFTSRAGNLVSGDTNPATDIFVHDRVTGTTTRVSVSSTGSQGDGASGTPSVSSDGRYVGFISTSTNLVSGDTNNSQDVFVHDRTTGTTTRVSVDSNGNQGNSFCNTPAISSDGRFVAFDSHSSNLVPGDTNSASDVFVHDRITLETRRVSVDSDEQQGNNGSYYSSLCMGGRAVAFTSSASNLVGDDTNISSDVFVRGPELSLDSNLASAGAGEALTLTEYGGVFSNPASLWAVSVSGTPALVPIWVDVFDDDGNFVVTGVVPPGLSGQSISFRGYAVGRSGTVIDTNDVTVLFR